MNKKNSVDILIKKLKGKIESLFSNDATGHNVEHLQRTLSFALKLQGVEGGDIEVVAVASFIHDVHRIMSADEKRYVSPAESIPKIKELIEDLPLTNKQKKHICQAVEHHEEYSFGKEKVVATDIESLIVQDADNLDAIGAMGIVRAFLYGAAHNRKEYDPTVPLEREKVFSESDDVKKDVSTIHHFYEKLFKIKDSMNTKVAKNIAEDKTAFMRDFVSRYIKEWKGE